MSKPDTTERIIIRRDFQIIMDMIEPKSKVLDLGCGDGTLLAHLIQHKQCHGTGIELDEAAIYKCVAKGLTVSHDDINTALEDYSDKRFDYVILSESVQQVLNAKSVILEALRVGKKVVVGIPNFCHLYSRLQLFFMGRVPVTKELPDQWYETPNLRFLSYNDFRKFCGTYDITILKQTGIHRGKTVYVWRNLLANIGIFLLEKQ
ncbi:MAG: methionine biosynthesis protein MetW [Candidatus Omnitrophica bacterium]|nr:methionine biosynthesis protein MetW [Candidatus Omnitrophota bacterium]